ncbi:MAG: desulfoferrodoxin [Desulfobacterales bacterium]|nr:desulfoferrodoxin [Desulfobacterales bacterium]
MIILNQVYKCGVCGNIIEIIHAGSGILICCGKPMILQVENTVDADLEKHVPVKETVGDRITVKIGSVAHPMEAAHYIEWIEVLTSNRVYRKYLNPELDSQAKADFIISGEIAEVRVYCNLHGLWKS